MNSCTKIFPLLLAFLLLASSVTQAQDRPRNWNRSNVRTQTKPKGWSRKAKGAVGGGVGGAVLGGIIGGKKGALIGAGAGVIGGGAIGRNQDKKKDPARYYHYRNKGKR